MSALPLQDVAPTEAKRPVNYRDRANRVAESAISDPPSRFLRALATRAFEAVEGSRTIAQLGTAITFGAARMLAEQRKVVRERSAMYRDTRVSSPSPGRVHLSRTDERTAQASVTVHTGRRSHAIAMRLEWTHERWKASEIYVL